MKIVKFNTLTSLLKLQLTIYNLFLYWKALCNKEIDCLMSIIEKTLRNRRMAGLWVLYPLKQLIGV